MRVGYSIIFNGSKPTIAHYPPHSRWWNGYDAYYTYLCMSAMSQNPGHKAKHRTLCFNTSMQNGMKMHLPEASELSQVRSALPHLSQVHYRCGHGWHVTWRLRLPEEQNTDLLLYAENTNRLCTRSIWITTCKACWASLNLIVPTTPGTKNVLLPPWG